MIPVLITAFIVIAIVGLIRKNKKNSIMFDFFDNKKNYNPDKMVLGNLTANQKKSVINLLYLIAMSDGNIISVEERAYLNTFYLGYSMEESASYLEREGREKMFFDLNQLTSSQKDYLFLRGLN